MATGQEPLALALFEDDLALGEWLHRDLVERFGLETEYWAVERVRRVERALQVRRAPRSRMSPEILWMQQLTAFTAPGRYLYVSRELLQRCASDDPLSFVLAHEMAHHDLGHLGLYRGRLEQLRRIPGGFAAALAARFVQSIMFSPEMESAADACAIQLCLRAGFDGRQCLEVFDILERDAIDLGDLDIVFGPDLGLDLAQTARQKWLAHAKEWGWKRLRGYPSIRERREAASRLL